MALLLPVTYGLDPAGSLIMFAGIYYGGMYGGSTTSILLNTPGESASIITALEGHGRGVYCGSIGWFGHDGDLELNIAIRTATFAEGRASLGAGCGITLLSDPAAELEEAELKAARQIDAFRRST